MFERYTEKSRRAVFFARYLAGHQGATSITTAHLLMGVVWEEDSRASRIGLLEVHKAKFFEVFAVSLPLSKVNKEQIKKEMPLEGKSKQVLAHAAEEAEIDGEYWIDTDHLLRAFLRFPNEAASALESVSLNLDDLRAASQRDRAEFPSERVPRFPKAKKLIRRGKDALVKLVIVSIVVGLSFVALQWLQKHGF